MNKRYFTWVAGAFLLCLFTGCFAPSTINDTPKNPGQTGDRVISDMRTEGLKKSKPFYLNEISSKAMRAFVGSYWNASDPTWVKYSGGYVVFFRMDGIPHKVYYGPDGDVQCTIRQFTVEDMPHEIRNLVENAYEDYSIFIVNEVSSRGKTSYDIKIEDEKSFKEIKIENGDMKVAKAFNKSK